MSCALVRYLAYRDPTDINRDHEVVVMESNNVAQSNILPSPIQRPNTDPLVSLPPEPANHGHNRVRGKTDTRNPKRLPFERHQALSNTRRSRTLRTREIRVEEIE